MPKRQFVDLHVKSSLSNGNSSPSSIARMAAHLGFKAIGLADFNLKNIGLLQDVRSIFESYGVDLIARADIVEHSPRLLKRALRKLRRKVEVIAVYCVNVNVARLAARDRRVDLLIFSSKSWRENFFDKSEAALALSGESALEVNLIDLIKAKSSSERIQAIRILSENLKIAKRFKVPVIFSSGATSIYEMRAPRELAALATLLGLTEFEARESLSRIPLELIRRNREKLSESYIMPGVRLIKKGEPLGKK
ncbi:MAG: hypothetical protein NDF55_06730 [archaeon GB-1867-005]|nr:hypothetical protein [Candidatus Culexmicrobium cathedralense]